jgi:Bacterial TniB protein
MSKTIQFDESLAFDALDEADTAIRQRRLATYSIAALRNANAIERAFVAHPEFARAVQMLDRLFQLGTELDTPQGACLVGPPGTGKTAVYKYFRNTLPSSSLFEPGTGVIGIRVPLRLHSGELIRALLRALSYPFTSGSYKQLFERRLVVFEAIKSKGTRLLWLDEAQHLIPKRETGTLASHEGNATEYLRELIDECRISVVLAGSEALDDLPKALPHLASRVCGREVLSAFAPNASWLAFLNAFSKQVTAIDLSIIGERGLAIQLHKATDGNPRRFKQLIVEASLVAHDAQQTHLDLPTLSTAYSRVFGLSAQRSSPFV